MQKFIAQNESRLDVFLAKILNQSRSQISFLIEKNCVLINEKVQNKNSFKLKIGDEICILTPQFTPAKAEFNADFELEILFEDQDVLVLNKIPNLIVHGAPSVKEATLVDWLIKKKFTLSNFGANERAGLVHRLDKDTSGAIIIAKNNAAHQNLSAQLQDKTMTRIYLALIDFSLKNDKIVLEKFLARSQANAVKKIVVEPNFRGAKWAKSSFINLASADLCALIAAKLFTGRTHQIRAHLASLNRHILGDKLYGYSGKFSGRVMLHSFFLYFKHPKNGQEIFVKAPLLDDFKQLLNEKMNLGENDEKIQPTSLLARFAD